MYFLPIHVPIYVRKAERLLTTEWKRSLLLLRDSFGGRYGRIHVVSPSVDASVASADQLLEPLHHSDEIDLFPSFPFHSRARAFWSEHVHTWRSDLAQHLADADVVHAGFDDVYRPMTFIAFLMGHRANKPTVFVQDTDHVLQHRELARGKPLAKQLKARAYAEAYERSVRHGVARASLSLLKGQTLIDRYGTYALNARNFHDTSFFSDEVVSRARLARRTHELLTAGEPLRLVYCGRLEARKGVSDSLEAIAQAGARVRFDIIGDGVERAALERQVQALGLTKCVRFLGMRPYGKPLLTELAAYDALLFTPTAEDTPRMIFDGYAAGLPLLGYGIPYVLEREREDLAAISCGRTPTAAATLLRTLDADRPRLAALSQRAREAALYHAADAWYRRRADWTDEAIAIHRAATGQTAGPRRTRARARVASSVREIRS
jgi:glycosyltransferase involved in cell wall biosynthesis